jgi:phosphate uptake regulator
MYKIDFKTLNEITKTLDDFLDASYYAHTGSDVIKSIKVRAKARKLSQKIKDNYTQIKK